MNLHLEHFGQVTEADIEFADLTVFVGPQATGKSIVLQLVKLLVDIGAVHKTMADYGREWGRDVPSFLQAYFGEGMGKLAGDQTRIRFDDKDWKPAQLAWRGHRDTTERMFFVPAQRVLAMVPGLLRPFSDYRAGDPFVLPDFSDKLRRTVEKELGGEGEVFPQKRRFKKPIRDRLMGDIFAGYSLRIEHQLSQKRFVLKHGEREALPFTVWSAGQREFVPLLLGFYQLLPPAATGRRLDLEWAVVEEIEMGLHPRAISSVLLLVLDLLSRDYRVCLSTHSPHVLDLIWALRVLRERGGQVEDVLDLFGLRVGPQTKPLAEAALAKTARVFYFTRQGDVRDISRLDPAAEDDSESGWGGLTEFSSQVGEIVSRVAARYEQAATPAAPPVQPELKVGA